MGRASRKMNFLIEDEVARELDVLVPQGKRSRIVNEALRKELELLRRRSAVDSLVSESGKGKKLKTKAIVAALSSDRESH